MGALLRTLPSIFLTTAWYGMDWRDWAFVINDSVTNKITSNLFVMFLFFYTADVMSAINRGRIIPIWI
jgi:hypothetical protein